MTDRGRHRRRIRALRAAAACGAVVAMTAPAARATTYVLDVNGGGDYADLKPAIAQAVTGDTILVAPGYYTGEGNSRVDFLGKDIVLTSMEGPEATTFGFAPTPGFNLVSGETEATVIEGLTLTYAGSSPYASYAVHCDGSSVTIRDCVFTENPYIALFLRGPRESTVVDCRFIRNSTAMWLNGVEATIRSCEFTENGPGRYPWYGGAIGMSYTDTGILIEDCTFIGNFVDEEGGAIESNSVDLLSIVDCVFEGNVAGGEGGAIAFHDYSPPDLGGPQIIRCTFRENRARQDGGAIHRVRTNFMATDCVFEGNTAVRGGAVYCIEDYEPAHDVATMNGCTFTDNRAEMGAAVMSVEAAPRLDSCLFDSNRASLWGGGLCADGAYEHRPLIARCTFTRNTAHRGAALVANDEVRPIVEYCTFYGCGGDDGVIASLADAFVYLTNSIVSFAPRGDPIHLQFGTATIEHCVVFGNTDGDWVPEGNPDNLFVDPRFCDVCSDDFTLCENSPCLEENNAWGESVGAHGGGCGDCESEVEIASWGRIKAMYR